MTILDKPVKRQTAFYAPHGWGGKWHAREDATEPSALCDPAVWTSDRYDPIVVLPADTYVHPMLCKRCLRKSAKDPEPEEPIGFPYDEYDYDYPTTDH